MSPSSRSLPALISSRTSTTPTKFFYILSGRALMQVGRDKREVEPGDRIHMPSNTVHRIAPLGTTVPMRALAFAANFLPPGGSGTEAERAELPE